MTQSSSRYTEETSWKFAIFAFLAIYCLRRVLSSAEEFSEILKSLEKSWDKGMNANCNVDTKKVIVKIFFLTLTLSFPIYILYFSSIYKLSKYNNFQGRVNKQKWIELWLPCHKIWRIVSMSVLLGYQFDSLKGY